jgi:hypothetical protein
MKYSKTYLDKQCCLLQTTFVLWVVFWVEDRFTSKMLLEKSLENWTKYDENEK